MNTRDIKNMISVRRNKWRITFLVLCAIFVTCVKMTFLVNGTGTKGSGSYVTSFTGTWRHFESNATKKILIWKPFLYDQITESLQGGLKNCPVKCKLTDDKSEIESADAVLFHLYNLWTEVWEIGTKATITFPEYRRPDQIWAVYNMEPPVNMYGDVDVFNGLFNWTVWYRKDATLWWPYGARRALDAEEVKAKAAETPVNYYAIKTKEIVGRISNCKDFGQRYKVVYELQKYLDVYMYGLCYDNICGDHQNQNDAACNDKLKPYKFYLSFENSQCNDYITEKYWWAILREQIPIVNWKNMNPNIPIPNSYINVYDFESIHAAADYIKKVSANETLYNSYFTWKHKYANTDPGTTCNLCKRLHDDGVPNQVYHDLGGWVKDDQCAKVNKINNALKNSKGDVFWQFKH